MNWIDFFAEFLQSHKDRISRILDAQGCREGWLQGELFLASGKNLQTNATGQKYDLVGRDPPMIAEIKICGGDYQGKMRRLIEQDVTKLKHAKDTEKYMILLIDMRHQKTELGQWLEHFMDDSIDKEVCGPEFKARIWKFVGERGS